MWVRNHCFPKKTNKQGRHINLFLPIFDDGMAEKMFMWVENTIMFMWVRRKTKGESADPTGAIRL